MLPIPVNMMFRPPTPSSPLNIPLSPTRRNSYLPNSFSELEASDLERMLPSSPLRRGTLEPTEASFMKELDLDKMIAPNSPLRRALPDISGYGRKSSKSDSKVGMELQGVFSTSDL
jgi:hypothetical protein